MIWGRAVVCAAGVVAALVVPACSSGTTLGLAPAQSDLRTVTATIAATTDSSPAQLIEQARQRVGAVFGVDYARLDEWERTGSAAVTGVAAERFTQYAQAVRALVRTKGLTSGGVRCRVVEMTPRQVDSESASAFTTIELTTVDDAAAPTTASKSYELTLRRVGSQWLISLFTET